MGSKNSKGYLLCMVILALGHSAAFGQETELNQVGTSMANFLKIGVGARATAMGDAYVALANDISSLYWNPGGLSTFEKNEILFQRTNWLLDTRLNFLGMSYNLRNLGVLGFSINSFSSGDIEETTIDYPDGTDRTFSASNVAAGLTYSRRLTDRFFAGFTLKYISEQLDSEKASTVAIDVGSVFVTSFFNDMRIGFALSNLGRRMQLDGSGLTMQYLTDLGKMSTARLSTEPWDIPLLFRFGIATDIIRSDFLRLTTAAEVMDSRDFVDRIATGGELAIREMVFLRGGYKFKYDEGALTLGGGLKFSTSSGIGFKIDYAYADYGIFDNTQRFSIILMF